MPRPLGKVDVALMVSPDDLRDLATEAIAQTPGSGDVSFEAVFEQIRRIVREGIDEKVSSQAKRALLGFRK